MLYFVVSTSSFSLRNLRFFLVKTARNHGIRSLWRGNTATLARVIPYASIQFTAHEEWKLLLSHLYGYPLPHTAQFVAGSLAGMTAVSTTYPLDMLRARMAVVSRTKYPNLFETVKHIYQKEGVATFYHGFTPTLLGIIPYAGVSFFTYERLKLRHRKKHEDLSSHYRLLYGAVAGICGQTCSYPLDVVRRRMQTAGALNLDAERASVYRKLMLTLKTIWVEGGLIGGIYKGLSLNWIKGPIASGLSFTTFDLTQALLRKLAD